MKAGRISMPLVIAVILIASLLIILDGKDTIEPPIFHDEVEAVVEEMSLSEKIAQMLLIGYGGDNSTDELISVIEDGVVGSVILLNSNIGTMEEILSTTKLLQESVPQGSPQLFISVDQEGGTVSRIKGGEELMKAQPEIKTKEDAYKTAFARGERLHSLGINVNFSPILENIQDANSFLYKRVFRGDNQVISDLGSSMVRGYTDSNIVSVVKHFPGHKDDSPDSHKGLPVIDMGYDALIESIAPFTTVLRDGEVEMVMMSHTLYPRLDSAYPSSISHYFITSLLRKELGFKGVVITDDMNMGAITTEYGFIDSAIQAVTAGNDILLYVVEPRRIREIHEALVSVVQEGIIQESSINESVYRIILLKQKYDLLTLELEN